MLVPFGLPVAAGDMQSASDSSSLMLDVIVIIGGSKGRSNEPGFSHCFSNLQEVARQLVRLTDTRHTTHNIKHI